MIIDFTRIEAFDHTGGNQNRMVQIQDSHDAQTLQKETLARQGKQIISDSRHLRKQVNQPQTLHNFAHNRTTSEDSNTLEIKRKI